MKLSMSIRYHILFVHVLCSFAAICAGSDQALTGKELYQKLNKIAPFVLSVGTSMSQTEYTNNTCHPDCMSKILQNIIVKNKNAYAFLTHPSRIWYTLQALPNITCSTCSKIIKPAELSNSPEDQMLAQKLIKHATKHTSASQLSITHCPTCDQPAQAIPRQLPQFTDQHKQALVAHIKLLNAHTQHGCQHGLPTWRLSIEACDVLHPDSLAFNTVKIQQQAAWLQRFGNTFLFTHHYSNPAIKPNLFENKEDIAWFAQLNQHLVQASSEITHICPISQPRAFSMRVARQKDLPPFGSNITPNQLFDNMIQAHVAAYDAIKAVRPDVNVYVSHQWKRMLPYHQLEFKKYIQHPITEIWSQRQHIWNNKTKIATHISKGALELIVCSIAHKMYNQSFVNALKKNIDKFDGVALSLYTPIIFDGTVPQGNNCNGQFDETEALNSIIDIHSAFPTKKITIAETGCSHPDPQVRKEFINMILRVCLKARELGIPVEGAYLWTDNNDPEYYREWGMKKGATQFGLFNRLSTENTNHNINETGQYVSEILAP